MFLISDRTPMAILALAIASLVAACTEQDRYLPGTRESIRSEAATLAPEVTTAAFVAPTIQSNANWLQSHGTPGSRTAHPALGSALNEIWRVNIGQGDRKRARISADPVVADGRVFTLDSSGSVTAVSTAGAILWQRDLRPERDVRNDVSGGGLSIGGGQLYVTTGYGNVHALDPSTGDEAWVQRLGASASAPATYDNGLVYLVAGDDVAWAIEAEDGRIRWQLEATEDASNVFGGPAPAVTDQFVIFGYGNGDVQSAFKQGGLRLWSATVAGQRAGFAANQIGDITGDPVVSGDRIYVANHSGRLVALSLGSGQRIWTAREGTLQSPWIAGNGLFAISDRSVLMRLDAETGAVAWTSELPHFTKKRRPQRRKSIYGHYGPILAGGQLIVASGDAAIRIFDPETGEQTREIALPGGATTNPVVAGGVLYLVTQDGQLMAFGG